MWKHQIVNLLWVDVFLIVDYLSDEVPVKIHLEAFNPCIPLDSKNSGIPVIIFNFTVTNPSAATAKVLLIVR